MRKEIGMCHSGLKRTNQTYQEVDGRATAKDVGTGHDSLSAGKPLGGARLVEGGSLGVHLHVARVDTRAEHIRVVEVALAGLNE